MATVNPGTTFVSGETFTPAKAHTLVDGIDVFEIDRDEMGSDDFPMIIKATAPSDTDLLWYNTTDDTFNRYEESQSLWAPYGKGARVTNNTGAALPRGAVVAISGADNEIDYCATGAYPLSLGVLQATVNDGSQGLAMSHGLGVLLCTGVNTPPGEPLVTSGATGYAVSATGAFGGIGTVSAGVVMAYGTATLQSNGLHTCYLVI